MNSFLAPEASNLFINLDIFVIRVFCLVNSSRHTVEPILLLNALVDYPNNLPHESCSLSLSTAIR